MCVLTTSLWKIEIFFREKTRDTCLFLRKLMRFIIKASPCVTTNKLIHSLAFAIHSFIRKFRHCRKNSCWWSNFRGFLRVFASLLEIQPPARRSELEFSFSVPLLLLWTRASSKTHLGKTSLSLTVLTNVRARPRPETLCPLLGLTWNPAADHPRLMFFHGCRLRRHAAAPRLVSWRSWD
jgi:hypothetical protein